ncbi:MAG: tRNA (guanosine(46)-N7)-methyltransferase TrmB [Anaerolineae bacterium]
MEVKKTYLSLAPMILWRQVERPVDWLARFGREVPLVVEIGFGNGDYLVRNAVAHPEWNFVGIEVEWPSVRRALRRIAQAGVQWVRIVQVDARIALERLFTERSIREAYALFPCPWPKERHAHRRLFSKDFLSLLNSRLEDDGSVLVVTDSRPYMEWVLEQAEGTGFHVTWRRIDPQFDTKYERKWREQGQRWFYEIRFEKQEHISWPVKGDVALKTYRIAEFDPERFQPVEERGALTVVFKSFMFDPVRERGAVHFVVTEDDIVQSVWVEIVRYEGEWHIRPLEGTGFIPTKGVQRALDLVYQAVIATSSPSRQPENPT